MFPLLYSLSSGRKSKNVYGFTYSSLPANVRGIVWARLLGSTLLVHSNIGGNISTLKYDYSTKSERGKQDQYTKEAIPESNDDNVNALTCSIGAVQVTRVKVMIGSHF